MTSTSDKNSADMRSNRKNKRLFRHAVAGPLLIVQCWTTKIKLQRCGETTTKTTYSGETTMKSSVLRALRKPTVVRSPIKYSVRCHYEKYQRRDHNKNSPWWDREKHPLRKTHWKCNQENHIGNAIENNIFEMQSRKSFWKCNEQKHNLFNLVK